MRTRCRPLLAELHAHTSWSDGRLDVRELVDLHGDRGFDVLCITDHVLRADDPWCTSSDGRSVGIDAASHLEYLAAVEREAVRARRRYGMIVIPGLELPSPAGRRPWRRAPDRLAHVAPVRPQRGRRGGVPPPTYLARIDAARALAA